MWTLFLASPAFAEEAPADEGTEAPAVEAADSCEHGCGRKEKKPMRHDLTGEMYVQGLADGGTALGGGAELVQGLGFLKVDARGESYQHWIGRATIGIDAFPRSRFDLTFGVFAGSVGHAVAIDEEGIEATRWRFSPTVGTEFGIGTGFGPVTVRWESAQGGGDERFREGTLRLGFDIVRDRFTTFGQVVYFEPEGDPAASGFGLGAALRI
jgi:hypothetical protein